MAMSKISESCVFICLLGLTNVIHFSDSECISPLGMEDGRIKDSQITVSSFLKTAYGRLARLRQNIPDWGAWCADVNGGKNSEINYDQYIQVDLLNLTKITRIATQGRNFSGGREKVENYTISYRGYGVWYSYRGKDQAVKIFLGNKNLSTVVRHDLDPVIMARYIRVHPGYYGMGKNVCMRLELYGCVVEQVILSYSMPVGQTTMNGTVYYNDTSYNGVIANGFYKDGTGILTDGKIGRISFTKEFKGEGWVGWSSLLTQSQYIDITFEFFGMRKFTNVTLFVNVNKKRSNAVFNRSQIFFSSTKDGFSDTSFLQYCPRDFPALDKPYNAHVTLSLCENTERFMKLRLYFGGKWLLISEISFNSVPASIDETMRDCSGNTTAVCTATQLSTGSLPTTRIPGCKNCSSGSNKLQLTIIIVCVILIVIVLLVVIFLLNRRQALCFGKMKQRNKTDKTVHVELQNVEDAKEPVYDTIQGGMQNETALEELQNNQEPDYSPADDETEPYEVVQISPPSVYAEPDRNRQDETTNDGAHQKLLKRQLDSDYVIPADGSPSSVYAELDRNRQDETTNDGTYQKLLKRDSDYVIPADGSPSSVYAELDRNRQDETTNDGTYQKLLKRDSDYAIPDHTEAESSYEEVGKIKTPPGYTELDNTKRMQDDSACYQKLIKK